jgi:Arm DNA-binding domain
LHKVPIFLASVIAPRILWQHGVSSNYTRTVASLLPKNRRRLFVSKNASAKARCCQREIQMPKPKRTLNDRTLKALKPGQKGKTYDVMDTIVPGFGVRVSETGRRTFILVARFPSKFRRNTKPGTRTPTRRALGEYGELTLEKARAKARDWLELIRKGIDPRAEIERQQVEQQRRRTNSFRAVAEEFIRLAVIGPDSEKPRQRKGHEVKRDIEKEFILRWGPRPITEITADDVVAVIDAAVARGSPYQAHNLLGHIRRLFNWAIARRVYGLDRSPCDRMKPKDVIGKKLSRKRVLDDSEIRAFWRATEKMGYPYGPLFRVLLLTIQRKSQVAEARRPEFDRKQALWIVPAERMKGDEEQASPHAVPLTQDVIAIIELLPEFEKGKHLFSTTFGKTPVNGFSKAKTTLDELMLAELREQAQAAGEDSDEVKLEPWVIHDLRRTGRTHLSALKVAEEVREAVIAHVRPGIKGTYDLYGYLDEKRDALTQWAARLRSIVEPPPANVIPMRTKV